MVTRSQKKLSKTVKKIQPLVEEVYRDTMDPLQQRLKEMEEASPSPSLRKENWGVYGISDLQGDLYFIDKAQKGLVEKGPQKEGIYDDMDFEDLRKYIELYASFVYATIIPRQEARSLERRHLPNVPYLETTYSRREKKTPSKEELMRFLSKGFERRGGYGESSRDCIIERLRNAQKRLYRNSRVALAFSYFLGTDRKSADMIKEDEKRIRELELELERYDSKYGPYNTNYDAFSAKARKEGVDEIFSNLVDRFAEKYRHR